jgi:hypothetical protein
MQKTVAALTPPPPPSNPKGTYISQYYSLLCILCCISICWFLLQVQFETFEIGQTVQFVKIEEPRRKRCVNRIKSPFIVCLEIRHKTIKTREKSKIFRVSQNLIRRESFLNSWLQMRFTTNTVQLSKSSCISICIFVDIALSYLYEDSTTFLKQTKYSALQYCTLRCYQYWKENWWYSAQL